jgi:hypothetical protein
MKAMKAVSSPGPALTRIQSSIERGFLGILRLSVTLICKKA